MQTAQKRRLLWRVDPLETLNMHQLAELLRIQTFIAEAEASGFAGWKAALRAHLARRLHAYGVTPNLDPARN